MRSLTVCRRTNIERHASVRGRAFWCGGVARSASRRLSCGFARVKRPNISTDFSGNASDFRTMMRLPHHQAVVTVVAWSWFARKG